MGASFLATLVAAVGGAALASLLKIPAAPLIGAMVGVGILKVVGEISFSIPSLGRWIIYCAVGWLLGQTVTRETVMTLRSAALPIVASVLLFLLFGLLLALALWQFARLDVYTALLAAAPGGISQMGLLSVEAKANVPIVLAVHVLRITSVIVLLSVGLKLMGGRA